MTATDRRTTHLHAPLLPVPDLLLLRFLLFSLGFVPGAPASSCVSSSHKLSQQQSARNPFYTAILHRIAFPLFWGRFGLPIPREVPLRIVFGAPLVTTTPGKGSAGAGPGGDGKEAGGTREVTDEELKKAHEEYVSALRRLFDDNKARFGYADRELVIL